MGSEYESESAAVVALIRRVDEYRTRCLWLLREEFYPRTDEERLRTLGYIEKHSTNCSPRHAFRATSISFQDTPRR